jgi:DUF438 domain-containing protein
MAIDFETTKAILRSIYHPLVFVDTKHIIRYLNKAAEKRYYELRGYADLIGKSIFDCHKDESNTKLLEAFGKMQDGTDEVYIGIGKYSEHVTITAVRDTNGKLIGYYERFEKIF